MYSVTFFIFAFSPNREIEHNACVGQLIPRRPPGLRSAAIITRSIKIIDKESIVSFKIDLKSAVLGVIAGVSVVFLLGAVSVRGKTVAWKYKIVSSPIHGGRLENDINSSVADGWDFVTVSDMSLQQYAFAVLRRAKQSD